MASVDNRIVSLQFDNSDFERKVQGTIKTLDELQKKLDFSGAKEGLSGLDQATKGFSLGGVGDAIEGISKKFLALSTVAITVLSNITNKAVDAGIQMVKSLGFEQIMAGFQEYELKLGSIQTIMAGSGASLDTVNTKLGELNTYSDKTIYSFKDMTSNIGKFTNAGLSLDTSVAAIQGVANVAAVSGANSEEASRAMYNFAQALSKGYVQLIDWKSIELANMGTVEFKQQLLDAAVAAGTLKKKGDEYITSQKTAVTATKNFNDSLTDQWLTTEVLTKTLGNYADETTAIGKKAFAAAQDIKTFSQLMDTTREAIGSGWGQTFELLIGNFDEAKQLWSGLGATIGDFVNKNAEARNRLINDWKNLGGRTVLIDAIKSAFHGLLTIITPIKEAFRDIFPPITAERLVELTKGLKDLADRLTISGETADKIKRIFRGVFSVISIVWNVIKELVATIANLISHLSGAGNGFLDIAAKVGDFLTNLRESLVVGGGIERFFQNLVEWIKKPIPYILEAKDAIVNFFTGLGDSPAATAAENVAGRISDRFETLMKIVHALATAFDWVLTQLKKVVPFLQTVWDGIKTFVEGVGHKLGELFKAGDFSQILDVINTGFLGGLLLLLRNFFKKGLKLDIGGGLLESLKGTLDGLTGTLEAMQTKIKADALLKIAEAIALLAASMVVLSLIDSAALSRALIAMSVGFGDLIVSLALLNQMGSGVRGGASLTLLTTSLVALAGAMLILSVAVKILSTMSWDEMARGLGATIILLGALILTAKLLKGNTAGMLVAGVGIMAMAVALNLLGAAMKLFATMSWAEMAQGFIGVAGGLLIIAGAMQLMPSNLLLTGAGLVLVAVGLNILAGAMKIFATMSMAEIGKGLLVMAGGLLIIAAAMQLMPLTLPLTALGLIMVGVALNIIAGALKIMASMSWGEIAKGLVVLALSLTILAAATYAMSGAIVGALAMIIVASALTLLAGVLKVFAGMKISDIVKALVALAAVFLVIGVAAAVLQPVIPAMIGLGVALLALGAGLALFGLGAYLAASAFVMLAAAGKAGISVLLALIDALLKKIPEMVAGFLEGLLQMVIGLGTMVPQIVELAGSLIVALLEKLVQIAPKLGETLIALIEMVITVVRAEIPNVVQLGFDILMAFLQGINNNIGQIVSVATDIIVNFLNGISDNMSRIVDAGMNLLTTFMNTIAERAGEIVTLGLNVLVSLLQGIGDNLQKVIDKAAEIIVKFINGIDQKTGEIISAGVKMITDLMTGVGNSASYVVSVGVDTVISFIQGVGQNAVRLANAAGDVIVDFLNGIASAIRSHSGEIRAAGENIASAIIDGITGGLSSKASSVAKSALDMAKGAVGGVMNFLHAGSPSMLFYDIGTFMTAGMSMALDDDKTVENSAVDVGNRAVNALQETIGKAAIIINQMPELTPTITPVLDLTQVQKDAGALAGMLQSPEMMAGTLSYSQAQTISTAETQRKAEATSVAQPVSTEIKFEQNNYSPEALSTNDIYRNTRNQIALAREELSIA